jgi:hypothetical protein
MSKSAVGPSERQMQRLLADKPDSRPASIVCAALVLALVVLTLRIVSVIW